jgi:Cu/Ag efflux protein CusF
MMAQGARELTATETTTTKATIVAIDKANRIVTLRTPKGEDWTVYADERVRRFNELQVGDVISASYSQALAVRIRKPGAAAPKSKTESLVRDADKIGAKVTKEQTVSVTVQEIDLPSSKLTVKDSNGKTLSFKVRDADNLRELKVGDKVDVTYTEALLLKADRSQ